MTSAVDNPSSARPFGRTDLSVLHLELEILDLGVKLGDGLLDEHEVLVLHVQRLENVCRHDG
jgi:hypothetical protein